MNNFRKTRHTYIRPLPCLGCKYSHIPSNLEMYLKGIIANMLFLVTQTNGCAWLHHILPKCTDLHHSHVFPTHNISLVPFPTSTLQKTSMCSFQFCFSAPFPPLVLNLSINNFYLASTARVWWVINSLNFKFQVSNRSVKILKSSRLSHHKSCGCCTASPQKLSTLLTLMRGLTCHDLPSEMQIFIDGTEVFQLLLLLLILLTLLRDFGLTNSLSLFCSRTKRTYILSLFCLHHK